MNERSSDDHDETEPALHPLRPDSPVGNEDETVAAGLLTLPEGGARPRRAEPVESTDIDEPALDWARRRGWIDDGLVATLQERWGSFDAVPDIPRLLQDSGAIDGDQRRELNEVVGLSREVPAVRLSRRLGAGAVGGVYLARMVEGGHQVAVKVLHQEIADQTEQRARFERETTTLSMLKHQGIPRLLGHDCDAKVPYCIMEYVPGVTLAELLDEAGALPETYVLWAAIQIAETLAYAWRRGGGLVHRDIKPENIIVELPEGTDAQSLFTSRYPLKVVDFGLARPQESATSLTMTGMILGTPRYMAPEQVRGEDLDWRADLYALGATCYHLLTGESPFDGNSPADVMMAHLQSPAPDPGERVPSLSRRTCGLVLRSMAKAADERYPDYKSFIHACEQALAEVDGRPMLLLRKPFVLPGSEGTGTDKAGDGAEGRSRGRGGTSTGTLRQRLKERHQQQRSASDRLRLQDGSAGLVPGRARSDPAHSHDEVFGGVDEGDAIHLGATNALQRVLEARARGEASELDFQDLDVHSTRLRPKTEAAIERSAETRSSVLPLMLLAGALVLGAAVVVLRFL